MGKKIVVVGGVAGGASFAARMRRLDEHASIVLFEKGDYISFANCGLPYHIGDVIKKRDDLIIQTPQKFQKRFAIDVRTSSEVVSVNDRKKSVMVRTSSGTYEESYDYLVLSPGSSPVRPPIPGIGNGRIFTLRSIQDMDRIIRVVNEEKAARAVIIGGGFIGLEMAENLRSKGLDVSLIEMLEQVFTPADREMALYIHQHLTLNGVKLFCKTEVKEFVEATERSVGVLLQDGTTIIADIVICATGVKPDTRFCVGSAIELTPSGAIIVNEHLQTSVENVYAVGDAVQAKDFISGTSVLMPLAGPANRQGRIAADNIAGINSVYKNTQGTAICKVFSMTIAVTGLNERNAKKYGIDYLKSYTHSASHATYYPGAFPMTIKLLFSPVDGRVLGTQIIGTEGVDKRIDVFATAVRHRLTVSDLSQLELAYAPPFGSAKDAVNMAGFVAENILTKKMAVFYPEEVRSLNPQTQVLLDVRTKSEHENGAIAQSINIPLDDLRENVSQLDTAKELFVYCQIGLRGYLACQILSQRGFRVRNLSGGYKTYAISQTVDFDRSYQKSMTESSCTSPAGEQKKKLIIDACGLQCPGPILKLSDAMAHVNNDEEVEVRATDMGFSADIASWCNKTKNTLVTLSHEKGIYSATIR
ncbi:MAG: FAD-dependent oxidoreductase, partial [Chitinivibrionales bacterium]|nr:FAD-dependent oxidoreductase [Chitinivibrionales bacterium]